MPNVSPVVIIPPLRFFKKSTSLAVDVFVVDPTSIEPFVVIILPAVAVIVVPAVNDPETDGLVARLIVAVPPNESGAPPVIETLLSLFVKVIELLASAALGT